jgi:hypothetical protein
MIRCASLAHFVGLFVALGVASPVLGAEDWLRGTFSPINSVVPTKPKTAGSQGLPDPPLGLAVSFCNAHVAESGKTCLWVRALTGRTVPGRL